jgi:thymidylate synthase
LKGDTNIKYLVDNGCNIWNGDCYANYLKKWKPENTHVDGNYIDQKLEDERPLSKDVFIHLIKTDDEFAEEWGELGPIYGKQWRCWLVNADNQDRYTANGVKFREYEYIDQIKNAIDTLKTNPDSRRIIVSAWNVAEIGNMVLPPCHYGFQVYTRELSLEERLLLVDKINKEIRQDLYTYSFNNPIYTGSIDQRPDDVERHDLLSDLNIPTRAISLMWNQRSVDTFLGLPFNIASYGLLLEIIAKEVNMVPDELIGNLGDVHLYKNHIEQAKEQIYREPMKLPKLNELPNYLCMKDDWECYKPSDFTLDNYQSHPTIKAPLSN